MARFIDINGCPVHEKQAPAVLEMQRRFKAKYNRAALLNSAYRGEDRGAAVILRASGKGTQAELIANPAAHGVIGTPDALNTSTHEGVSDGRAFPGPVGRKLDPIQWGLDFNNADISKIMAIFREMGCAPIHPYPTGTEYHHICLTKYPKAGAVDVLIQLQVFPLKPSSSGTAQRAVQVYLSRAVGRSWRFKGKVAKKTATYGSTAVTLIKRFQKAVGLPADGIIGPKTFAALRRRYSWNVIHHIKR